MVCTSQCLFQVSFQGRIAPHQKNLQFPQTAAKWRANQVSCKRFLTDVFFYGQQTQEIIRHFAIRVQIYAPKMHQHTFSGAGGA